MSRNVLRFDKMNLWEKLSTTILEGITRVKMFPEPPSYPPCFDPSIPCGRATPETVGRPEAVFFPFGHPTPYAYDAMLHPGDHILSTNQAGGCVESD
jgi:hypothetical protein